MSQTLQRIRLLLPALLLVSSMQLATAQIASPVLNKAEMTIEKVSVPHLTRFDSAIPYLDNDPQLSCGLKLDETPYPGFYFRAPKQVASKSQSSTISISFNGPEWNTGDGPDAMAAALRAAATWEQTLTSSETIKIDASFAALGPGVLGSAGPCSFWSIGPFGAPMPVNSNNRLVIGDALADQIVGSDVGPLDCDIEMTFSSSFASWNFSTSPPAPGEWDFQSVVTHEIGHGLDFLGFASWDDGATTPECDGVAGHGCQQVAIGGGFSTVEIFNYYVEDGGGDTLWNYVKFPENSTLLGDAFQGDSPTSGAGLFWHGASGAAENGGPAKLYTPSAFEGGSTFSHLEDATFDGTMDNMMTHSIFNGEMARAPGPVTCGMMEDQGWSLVVPASDCPNAALPVEMIDFVATVDNYDIVVSWKTASEGDNAGFELEHRLGEADFETLAFLPGAGNSAKQLAYSYRVEGVKPGLHSFRLKQIDVDGSAAYGYEIESFVGVPDGFYLRPAYPNPFSSQATVQFATGASQDMRVELYDAQGRLVRLLYDGVVDANSQYDVQIESAGLSSGVYTIRLAGDRTLATERVVLMK